MELKDIIKAFADDFGTGELRADASGAYAFDIDDFRVSFSETADGRSVLMRAEIAELPATGRERLLRTLLESFGSRTAVCSLEPGGERLFLQRTDALDGLDLGRLEANLESFVNELQAWRDLISDYAAVADEQEANDDFRAPGDARTPGDAEVPPGFDPPYLVRG